MSFSNPASRAFMNFFANLDISPSAPLCRVRLRLVGPVIYSSWLATCGRCIAMTEFSELPFLNCLRPSNDSRDAKTDVPKWPRPCENACGMWCSKRATLQIALYRLGSDVGRVKRHLKTEYFCVFTLPRPNRADPPDSLMNTGTNPASLTNSRRSPRVRRQNC